jgi:hypothetical protein
MLKVVAMLAEKETEKLAVRAVATSTPEIV